MACPFSSGVLWYLLSALDDGGDLSRDLACLPLRAVRLSGDGVREDEDMCRGSPCLLPSEGLRDRSESSLRPDLGETLRLALRPRLLSSLKENSQHLRSFNLVAESRSLALAKSPKIIQCNKRFFSVHKSFVRKRQ